MAEENVDETASNEPVKKYKYNIDLGGNRGTTVQKFTREEADKQGLTDEDMVDGQDVGAAAESEPKAKTPANKSKPASNK
jgi:hypothetical protein